MRAHLAPGVGVRHVAEVAAVLAERRDEEAREVRHAADEAALRGVVAVVHGVVDDVALQRAEDKYLHV